MLIIPGQDRQNDFRRQRVEITMILCAAVIAVCIALHKFFYRFGIPAILIFMGVGMLFGSEGLVKIPFSDYETAEVICSTALVFIMFYGGFGTSFTAARPILTKAISLSTLGVVITAGIMGLFCHYILGCLLYTSVHSHTSDRDLTPID